MRIRFLFLLLLLLNLSSVVFAAEKIWNVRYSGGPLRTNADPKEWNNEFWVGSEVITLTLHDGQKLRIEAKSVTGLSYGQEAYHRVSTMFVVFGLFHKSREHFIGIEYTQDGNKEGLLLQGDKDDYRDILIALKQATGVSIAVSDKDDLRFVNDLDGSAEVAKTEGAPSVADSVGAKSLAAKPGGGVLHVTAQPEGSDVYVDSDFAGKTPCIVPLAPGRHRVTVVSRGFIDWSKDFKISAGEQVSVKAALQKAAR